MGWVEDKLKKTFRAVTSVVSAVADFAGDVLSTVGKAITGVVDAIGNTITNIIKDPLPTLLQVAGMAVGIPPYVTAAVITAAKGGNLEDIALSAAVSYISAEAVSSSGIGQKIGEMTKTAGQDFTNTMMENFNLPPDTAVAIAKAATASMNSSIIGGVNAAISGKNVMDGITSGFTSGLVYSSTSSYFDSLNKDPNWGFTPKALDMMKGATSSALNSIVSGKDPSQAVGNYIAYATLNMGQTELSKQAKQAYVNLTTDTEAAKKAQDVYVTDKAEYDTKAKESERLRESINADSAAQKKIIEEQYTPFKNSYDEITARNTAAINGYNEQKAIFDAKKAAYDANPSDELADAANEAGRVAKIYEAAYESTKTEADNLRAANQPMLDGLESAKARIDNNVTAFNNIKAEIETPTGDNLAARLKASSTEYQTKYEAWSKTKDAADRSAENYTKALAEVATRDATIDALNNGAITVTSKDAEGNWTLSNGMTLTSEGKFIQDGKQAFTTAAGIPQAAMDFKAADGSNVDFDESAGRKLSETDVETICRRDYGFVPSAEEIAQLAGSEYTPTTNNEIKDFADDKVRDTFSSITGKPPTDEQVNDILKQGNVVETAANEAINGLDLPENYVFPGMSLNDKITRGQAYAAARAAYGPNATFEFGGKLFTTESAEEQVLRLDKAAQKAGKYEAPVVSYAKYKMLDNLSSTDFNPADLTKGEMTQFVDAYSKATPQQRAAMLKGSDSATFKAIDTVLGETARYNPTGEVAAPYKGAGTGSISAYNPQGVERVLDAVRTGSKVADASISLASYDAAGVITRSAQLLQDALGIDSTTAGKIQQFWSDSKDKSLKSLASDDQRVIAGGIASGLESIGAFAAAGPVGALITLGSIAANNAYQEGATTWMDKTGKAYANKDEAIRAVGLSNIRQLTPEENMQRTAVMTALEIAGEAAGIPGMRLLMKGIPLTGSAAQIVNAVKNFGVGLANEQVSELLTTTAQMAADKWADFGLNQNATVDDYVKALRDTALATTAAVGTAGSISTATRNMLDLKSYANPFSTNTGLDTVSPTVPTLKEAAKLLGINESDFGTIQRNIQNSVRAGNNYVDSAQEMISQSLQVKGMSAVRADAVANGLSEKITDMTVNDFLKASGMDPASAASLTPLITSQLDSSIATGTAAKNIASIFASAGMDPTAAGKAASKFYSYTVSAPTLTQNDLDLSNQLLQNAGVELGSVYKPATGTATKVVPSGATVTSDQLQTAFGTTGSKTGTLGPNDLVFTNPNAGVTTNAPFDGVGPVRPTDYASTGALTGGVVAPIGGGNIADVQTTINNVIANTRLPEGVTPLDVSTAITNYMTANPGMSPDDVANAVATYFRAHPQLTSADVNTAIASATSGLATKADIQSAISAIQFPPGINITDVSDAISSALAANPGLTATDVAQQISNYMTANPGLTPEDVNAAVVNATKEFATKTEIADAISGIQFPAGLTPQDVTDAITSYMTANPGLKAADVAEQLANYMTTNPVASPDDLDAAITAATKDLVKTSDFNTAIENLTTAQQSAFNNLSQAQKDIIASQFQQGTDLGASITSVQQSVTDLESRLTNRISELLAQGVTQSEAVQQAILETQGQITANDTRVTTRISELLAQGLTNQEATEKAISETRTQITDLGGNLNTRIDALVAEGMTNQEATNKALEEVRGQITSGQTATDVRIAELIAQGMTNQEATNKALEEMGSQISGGQTATNVRIAELISQGMTNQEATQKAIQETQGKIADLGSNVDIRIAELLAQGLSNQQATEQAIRETQTQISSNQEQTNLRIAELIAQGLTNQEATNQAIRETREELSGEITTAKTQLSSRVDELMLQGKTYQEATQAALGEIKATQAAEAAKAEAAAKAGRAGKAQAGIAANLARGAAMVAPAAAGLIDTSTPGFADIGLKTTGGEAKFEGPLERYLKMLKEDSYAAKPQQPDTQQTQQVAPVQDELSAQQQQQPAQSSDYFNYGQLTDIDLAQSPGTGVLYSKAGGLATPLFAGGGNTRHGKYSGGGLGVVEHSGKARLDFRTGDAVTGPGDGQSDDIPAMLADGEFVFPADVVAALGNGSTKAGSDKLYDMMHSIRAYHRSAKPKDLPPPAKKSPLDYLEKPARKVRR